jgi:hypothetical protein
VKIEFSREVTTYCYDMSTVHRTKNSGRDLSCALRSPNVSFCMVRLTRTINFFTI